MTVPGVYSPSQGDTPTAEGESGEPTDEMIAAAGQYLGGEDYEWTARQVWRAMSDARPSSTRVEHGEDALVEIMALDGYSNEAVERMAEFVRFVARQDVDGLPARSITRVWAYDARAIVAILPEAVDTNTMAYAKVSHDKKLIEAMARAIAQDNENWPYDRRPWSEQRCLLDQARAALNALREHGKEKS